MVFALPLLALYQAIVGSFAVSVPMTIIMIVAGFLFCSVSAYMAGLVGSSNNPVSGITIATILFASLVLVLLLGRGSALGPIAAIMIGAVVCCAAAVAGDNLQDLKAGQIVGATPWRQQVMLAIGAVSCAFVMAPVLNVLEKAYGIGVPTAAHPKPLLAPQATLMASVSKGMFGGALPWGMIADRRRDRRRDHRARRDSQGTRRALPRARARGRRSASTCRSSCRVPIFIGGLLDLSRRAQSAASAATPTRSSACTAAACCSRRA